MSRGKGREKERDSQQCDRNATAAATFNRAVSLILFYSLFSISSLFLLLILSGACPLPAAALAAAAAVELLLVHVQQPVELVAGKLQPGQQWLVARLMTISAYAVSVAQSMASVC